MKMTHRKVRRCEAPHCRTLTTGTLCDRHRAERAAEQTAAPAATLDDATWTAMLAEAWRRVRAAREQREERHEALDRLRLAARRADRAGQQPRFSVEPA
jgi:hypothetical protein